MNPPRQITIIGAGLLGGSVGLGLKARGFRGAVIGCGRTEATLDRAVACGCIDHAERDLPAAVAEAGLIVIATPVSTVPHLLQRIAEAGADAAVITDVGSTKHSIVEAAGGVLRRPGRFVGSHPMAGSEVHGPDAARPDLFDAKPVVVTPTDETDDDALATIEWLWRMLDMRLVRMEAAEHDRIVARISHLPHAVAMLLVEHAAASESLDLASTGFADTTRVASGDPGVWADILTDNAGPLGEAIDEWIERLQNFRQQLSGESREELLARLRGAKNTRDGWLSARAAKRPNGDK